MRITTLPTELRRSITWDQGKELAEHLSLYRRHRSEDLLLRSEEPVAARSRTKTPTDSYVSTSPKAPNSTGYSQAQLNAVARELNGRPRRTLGGVTPSEAFAEAVASTG